MSAKPSSQRTPVFQQKFQVPGGDRKLVSRDALIRRIRDNPAVHCFLVQAPAGHGKSTLLQQLLRDSVQRGIQTAWLKLDDADNDLTRLMNHLNHLLSQLEDACPPTHEQAAAATSLPKGLADQFNNRLLEMDRDIHLFFDDFQVIDEGEVEALFRNIIINLPARVCVFIGSRSLPRIGIPEMQVNQQVELIRYDELKFSLDEAREFFTTEQRLSLSEEELSTIYSRTEGWPAALQLFRLTLSRMPVRESLNNLESYTPFQITEYLSSNVLAQQAEDIQDFLLSCAMLPRLNAALCEYITGREDSQALLEQLEQQGLFLNNIDNERCWFQFHALFAHYLRELMLKRSVSRYRKIHARAAEWSMAQGLYEDAMRHALNANNFNLATQAMDIWASEQITNACLHSVERWAARLPIEHIREYPRLAVKITWALTFLRRRNKVLPYLEILRNLDEAQLDSQFRTERQITMAVVEMALDNLERCFANASIINTENHEAEGFWAFELGAAANIQAFNDIAHGNFAAARYHIALGRNHSHEGQAPFLAGYNTGLTIISCYLQGRVDEACQRSMSALKAKGLDIEDSYAAVATVCCTLYPLYEQGDTETAMKVFTQYRKEIDTGLLLDFVAAAYLPMIRLYDARGEAAQAEALLESLEDIGITANWQRVIQLCHWEAIRRAIIRGDIQSAKLMADNQSADKHAISPRPYLPFSEASEDPELGRLRLAVYLGDDETLEQQLGDAIVDARDNNRIPRELKLRLLSALWKSRQNKADHASKELKIALTMAADYGFVRSIIDEGPELMTLIQAQDTALWPANIGRYINKLRSHATHREGAPQAGTEAAQLTESLTAREMQMLSLLAKGQTNKDIARHLFVSENTVKFHLKNIFHKLQVKTRTQAISSALALGLV
ncbi:LuxR C-terminal-related transcriptional regulator [Spongiibacter tropicus]|uniref:LuxR C-terminal-related transcriptional regulator n=1 Tax=Spongiibacter tropicus TaxID=454602 RepID=UPI0003B4470B|nr:LuxR C-terminal-related transcriptional regulator [Spongiibacter tropicus]